MIPDDTIGCMVLPLAEWRLVHSTPDAGAWNMSVDEAILEAAGKGLVPPTLRLYAWNPPCLSLGYAQSVSDVDQGALAERGWEIVRRPTGGRAILHTDELTYSISVPHSEPRLAGSVLESYQRVAQALLQALLLLTVPAKTEEIYAQPDGADPKGAVCFDVPSNWEITVDGKKLIGSAQVRKKAGVMQHGTLPLQGDLSRITQVLGYPSHSARNVAVQRLLSRATTVEAALARQVTWENAAAAISSAFEQTLHLKLIQGELTEWEIDRARKLCEEKYANPAWTERV
jgi:lipoyl(octanoyl) transferase